MSDDAAIVKEFLIESYENLDRLDQDLVVLEKEPANRETLASIFRTIHTIKGTSGFLAFNELEAVTHAGESLLSRLRDGLLPLNAEITSALLAMLDAVREMLKNIETSGKEGERNDQELILKLARLLEAPAGSPASPLTAARIEPPATPSEQPVPNLGEILIKRGVAKASEVNAAVEHQKAGDPRHVGEILVERGAVKPQDIVEALNAQQQARGQSASDSTIRVDVSQLDRLMNRVGEMVLLRNQIVQYTNSTEDSELLATSQRLNLLTTELQEGVMKTRMQPIGNVWSKFPRTVRDVALGCGKQVRIEMEGKETELDKTIIEAIKDPLTHLVRNAVDHGIEPRQGSTVRMKIPLTLAIIPALIVTSAGDRYAIPQVSLLELVRLEGEQSRKGLEFVNGAPVYRLRGKLLPLVYLQRELRADSQAQVAASLKTEFQSVNIVVLRADDRAFGLVVDEINDTEEIVVKQLSKKMKSVNIYDGGII